MGTDSTAYYTAEQWYKHWGQVLPGMQKALAESESYCVDPECRDTNWGGSDRVHYRGEICPKMTNVKWCDLFDRIVDIKDHLNKYEDKLAREIEDSERAVLFYANKIMEALK